MRRYIAIFLIVVWFTVGIGNNTIFFRTVAAHSSTTQVETTDYTDYQANIFERIREIRDRILKPPTPGNPDPAKVPQTPDRQPPSTATSEIEAIFAFNSTIDRDFEAFLNSGDSIDVAVEKIRTTLLARGDLIEVDSIESTSDGGLIWLSKQEGIPIVLDPDVYKPDREEQPVSSAAFNSIQHRVENSLVKSNLSKEMLAQKDIELQKSSEIIAQNSSSADIIGNNKALVLSPFAWQLDWLGRDSSDYVAAQLDKFGFDVTYKWNSYPTGGDVTLADFQELDQYGFVYIVTHGGAPEDRGLSEYLLTYSEITPEEYKKIRGQVLKRDFKIKGEKLGVTVKNQAVIFDAFINQFIGNMPSSLIYIHGCESLTGGVLAQAFLNKGAGAYLGNDQVVNAFFSAFTSKQVVDELLNGKTVASSTSIKSYLKFRGNPNLKVVRNELSPANTTMDAEKTVELHATFPNPTGSNSIQRNLLLWSADDGNFSPDVQYDCSAETQCSGTVKYTAPKDGGEYKIRYIHVADDKITAEAIVKVEEKDSDDESGDNNADSNDRLEHRIAGKQGTVVNYGLGSYSESFSNASYESDFTGSTNISRLGSGACRGYKVTAKATGNSNRPTFRYGVTARAQATASGSIPISISQPLEQNSSKAIPENAKLKIHISRQTKVQNNSPDSNPAKVNAEANAGVSGASNTNDSEIIELDLKPGLVGSPNFSAGVVAQVPKGTVSVEASVKIDRIELDAGGKTLKELGYAAYTNNQLISPSCFIGNGI